MIKDYIKRKLLTSKWKKINSDSETAPGNVFDINVASVGKHTYGRINAITFNSENKLKIGSFCSIGPEVMFMLSGDHYTNRISTFPFKAKIVDHSMEGVSKGDIIVDDDVWIGYRSTILSGVHIGQGAVIAAGSIVSKDVPPYAIFGGVPAKLIKYRFSDDIIEFLTNLDYNMLDDECIIKHVDELYTPLYNKSYDEVKEIFKWFPKKREEK